MLLWYRGEDEQGRNVHYGPNGSPSVVFLQVRYVQHALVIAMRMRISLRLQGLLAD
jgi:hypothetical protein